MRIERGGGEGKGGVFWEVPWKEEVKSVSEMGSHHHCKEGIVVEEKL